MAAFVPKFAVFLLILIAGHPIARAIAKILSKVLTRVGFDRLVERGGVKRAPGRSSYDASGVLAKVVFYAITVFVSPLPSGCSAATRSATTCAP